MTDVKVCPLFRGLTGAELEQALTFFNAKKAAYAKGSPIHLPGEVLPFFGLVLSGMVEVSTDDYDGRHIVMAMVEAGATFGESLCFLEKPSSVSISAIEDTVLLKLTTQRLKAGLTEPWEVALSNRFTAMLARRTLEMNNRIQILSMPSLRKKIILYLSLLQQSSRPEEKGKLTLPLSRAAMADFLAADRSALCRELSAMQRDGLITYRKNQISLLSKMMGK